MSAAPDRTIDWICDRLPPAAVGGARRLIAFAGPPASGKSTLAEAVAARLPGAGYVPMDGFHLDNRLLDARGQRAVKGAPQTFDAAGFVALIHRLKQGGDLIVPLFDRTRDLSVAGAAHIPASCKTVVVEGNYLLFDQPLWRDLAGLWDVSFWLDVAEPVLARRLVQRWQDHGLDSVAATAKAESNDLPNARLILSHRLPATWDVPNAGDLETL